MSDTKSNDIKASIVIAAYNEKGNLEELSKNIADVMRDSGINYELILVIEGDDGTYESILDLMKNDHCKRFIVSYSKDPLGFGNAFRKGFSLVSKDATHIITMDADLNHDPADMPRFIETMDRTGSDIIIGSRYVKGSNMYKREFIKGSLSTAANKIFPKLLGLKIKDISSGYRIYRSEVIRKCADTLKSNDFSLLPEILIRSKRYKMTEVPITFRKRPNGESKFDIWKTSLGYFRLVMSK